MPATLYAASQFVVILVYLIGAFVWAYWQGRMDGILSVYKHQAQGICEKWEREKATQASKEAAQAAGSEKH